MVLNQIRISSVYFFLSFFKKSFCHSMTMWTKLSLFCYLPTTTRKFLTLNMNKIRLFDHLPTPSSPSSQWTSLYFKLWNKKRLCEIRIWFTSGEKITRVARGKLCDFVNYTPENWEPKMETIYLECISCWLLWDHPCIMSAYFWTFFDPPTRHASMNTELNIRKMAIFKPIHPVLLLT